MKSHSQSEIVIARYSEDLDWVGQIPAGFNVIIFNKGAEITSPAALARADSIVKLANSGRESDTILRHIASKQSFGEGFTVFLQGNPFEHSPDIINLLKAQMSWKDLQPLSWRWLDAEDMPPAEVLARETTGFVAGSRVRPELFSLLTWSPLQYADPGTKRIYDDYRRLHDLPNGVNIAGHFLRRCEWTELADQAENHLVGCFSYGAIFAVRQSRLAQVPRKSIQYALEAANGHQMYGYILERLWMHMFGEPFLLQAPTPALFREDFAVLPARFTAVPEAIEKKPLHRRVVPAVKRRIVSWAQT